MRLIPNPNRKVNNLYINIIYLQIVTLSLIAVYIKNWNYALLFGLHQAGYIVNALKNISPTPAAALLLRQAVAESARAGVAAAAN
ncbi:hypothetical protein SAMN05421863_101747 [Nitrosomonas communis]|uniref:Uncharacterized protein n=1 Tax=Nitrosomonas communis TaxID=44574 RepID=A0A1I4P089_9PROT|nr:hypothetical protein SAMN05421863_101747 [Nitrosomonas communis]